MISDRDGLYETSDQFQSAGLYDFQTEPPPPTPWIIRAARATKSGLSIAVYYAAYWVFWVIVFLYRIPRDIVFRQVIQAARAASNEPGLSAAEWATFKPLSETAQMLNAAREIQYALYALRDSVDGLPKFPRWINVNITNPYRVPNPPEPDEESEPSAENPAAEPDQTSEEISE